MGGIVIQSRYPGICAVCRAAFAVGSSVFWTKGAPLLTRHVACIPQTAKGDATFTAKAVIQPEKPPIKPSQPVQTQLPSAWEKQNVKNAPQPGFGTAYGRSLAKKGAPPDWVLAKARKEKREQKQRDGVKVVIIRKAKIVCLSRIGLPFPGGLPHPAMSTMCCFTGEIIDGEWI